MPGVPSARVGGHPHQARYSIVKTAEKLSHVVDPGTAVASSALASMNFLFILQIA